MRRRSYLALTASALSAAAAGCTSQQDGDADPSDTTTTTTTATSTTRTTTQTESTPGFSVSVADVTLQPAALELQTDYLVVHDEGQYLFVNVVVEEGTVEDDEFALQLAGESYAPLADQRRRRLWRAYNAGGYDPDRGGLVAFEVPGTTEASDPQAVLEYPGAERELAPGLRARLAANPEFAFDVSVPDTVAEDDSLSVAIAVTNEGDAPARFVGGLNRSGPRVASTPVQAVRPLVPAGESVTTSIDQSGVPRETPPEDVGDGEADARFSFASVAGDVDREVRVVDSE
jgi:hypothetical protein